MRVLICPDSFKGTVTAADAAQALAQGWLAARPDDHVETLGLADGGEGTSAAFLSLYPDAKIEKQTVVGPGGLPVLAEWLTLSDGTAILDLASTSGITLLEELNPLDSHTFGLGQALSSIFRTRPNRILVGVGGSASTDGGVGALAALGLRALDSRGHEVPLGGRHLVNIATIEPPEQFPPAPLELLVDVTSPLVGPSGAAQRFGPQKGANPEEVDLLDRGLQHLARILKGDATRPGAGAAGGTAYGLVTCLGASLRAGAEEVGKIFSLEDRISAVDIVITGEGCFDKTSLEGKVVGNVLRLAGRQRRIVHVVAGRNEIDTWRGGPTITSLTRLAGSGNAALQEPVRWLFDAAHFLARTQSSLAPIF